MGYRRTELVEGELFHCYSRTIDHSRPFDDRENTERFLETLYLGNQNSPMPSLPFLHKKYSHEDVFSIERTEPLVAIGAYCIMPTHYHLLIQPVVERGITEFMRKVGTGFTMYYNEKHRRVGNLFIKPFRSKHVSDDRYYAKVTGYIHLNPMELIVPEWKQGKTMYSNLYKKRLLSYTSSSLPDYFGPNRPQKSILDPEIFGTIQADLPTLRDSMNNALEYYRTLEGL